MVGWREKDEEAPQCSQRCPLKLKARAFYPRVQLHFSHRHSFFVVFPLR